MLQRLKAFTLIEILISMLIFGILSGVILTAFWIFWGVFYQTEDHTTGRGELEYVFQSIGREMTNVSLGMPNNRKDTGFVAGSFAQSFRVNSFPELTNPENPITAYMGEPGQKWGGPVTLADFNGANPPYDNFQTTMVRTEHEPNVYVGPQIYYAWSEPVFGTVGGVRVPIKVGRVDNSFNSQVGNYETNGTMFPNPIQAGYFKSDNIENSSGSKSTMRYFYFASNEDIVGILQGFQTDNRSAGLKISNGADMRSWIAFPTLRIPLLLRGYTRGNTSYGRLPASVQGRPQPNVIGLQITPASMDNPLGGFEEVHVIQVCRLYVNANRELIQEFFADCSTAAAARNTAVTRVLARNVAGMCFRFDRENRLLTMYLAVRGEEANPRAGAGKPLIWPDFAPAFSAADLRYRIFAQSMTWRIRN
ncbi:MAG: type II secretion system GspH family protein [Synergistaceae bacterium]|jgi:prepilin-type N-terminal cleavage/methylation domain-containing protein|nr:type II secretion system GspH family protein [Synergistaceae bacterium]